MQKDRYSEDRVIEIKGETKTLTVKDNVTVQETLSASKVEATDASQPSTFAGNVTVGGAINANSIETTSGVTIGGAAAFYGSQKCKTKRLTSSPYSVADSDYFIVCSANNATITLPYSGSSRVFIIKNHTSTALTINAGSLGSRDNDIYSGTSTTGSNNYTLAEYKSVVIIGTANLSFSGRSGTDYWIVSYL